MNKKLIDDYLKYDQSAGRYVMDPEQKVRDQVERDYWKIVLRNLLRDWRLYLMLFPMLFIFFCWRYLPMYELLASFKINLTNTNRVAEMDFVGFSNFYKAMFGTRRFEFWQAFRNTFVLSAYGLLFGFPVPIILALFFNEIKSNAYRSILQVLTYLPKFISTVIITTLVWMLLSGEGLMPGATPGVISKLLVNMGLISKELAKEGVMFQAQYFRPVYIIQGIWEGAGYGSIVYFAAVIAVSPTNYEAAQMDGAGKMQQLRYVVLPAMLSTIVIMLIVRIGSLLSIGYETVLLLQHNRTYETSQVISTLALKWKGDDVNLATVPEMLNNITSMLLVIGANMISRKVTETSLY